MIAHLAMFLGACGYKSNPFYTNNTENTTQQDSSHSVSQPQSIQSIDSRVVTGGEGE